MWGDSAVLMFDLILASSNTHKHTHTKSNDCCTVSGWLIKWCDSFWLIWELSGNVHSENLLFTHTHIYVHARTYTHTQTHTHTHTDCLDWGTDHIWENGSPFIAFIIIAPAPSSRFHSPSPLCYFLLVIYCPTLHITRLETFCVSGWCVNDHTLTHPPTTDTYCVFMTVGFFLSFFFIIITLLCFLVIWLSNMFAYCCETPSWPLHV